MTCGGRADFSGNDLVVDANSQRRLAIDLGCGKRKVKGALGVDAVAMPGVDIVADINHGLPLRESSVDAVYAYHVLEHMDDFLAIMDEIWRVCRPGARVFVKVPHAASSFVTWKDPTHRRGLSIATFAYFDDTYFDGMAFAYYSRVRFHIERAKLNFTLSGRGQPVTVHWQRKLAGMVFHALANHSRRSQYFCERFWGPLVGIEEAELVMRATKRDPKVSPEPAAE